jgi:hypothetical protein
VYIYITRRPIPGAARPKACVCGSSLNGIAGSNPAGTWMSVSSECCVLSCNMSLRRADHLSRGILQSVLWMNVTSKPQKSGGPSPLGPSSRKISNIIINLRNCNS